MLNRDIDHFPLFLETSFMPRHSWDTLVTKIVERILLAERDGSADFTMYFMGSSVTAGYDAPYRMGFSVRNITCHILIFTYHASVS